METQKVILYMVTSIDGKITSQSDDTSWIHEEDFKRLDNLMVDCGVMIMGSSTYEQFGDDLPNDKALQIICTSKPELLKLKVKNTRFTNQPLDELLKDLKKEFKNIMIAGGTEIATSFLNLDLIDEIRLLVEPLVIGKGKFLFNDVNQIRNFKLISSDKLPHGSIELKFIKIKNGT